MRGEGQGKFSPVAKEEPQRAVVGEKENLGLKTIRLNYTTTVKGKPANEISGHVDKAGEMYFVYPSGPDTIAHYSFHESEVQSIN